jgi:transcriptional regulator with XRE-family HTH domain
LDIAERFGNNLARLRQDAGLTQEELANQASVHRTQVGLLEAGKRLPRIDTLIKLAGALGVNSEQLLRGIAWSPPATTAGRFKITARD